MSEPVMTHGILVRANAFGTTPAVWRCGHCRAEGTIPELVRVACSRPGPATTAELVELVELIERRPS